VSTETATPGASRPTPAASDVQSKATSRLLFVDNIRVFLTILVLLHHLMIIYAGTGGFYYKEGRQDFITSALGGWFCQVNQAYFMGLFLLISAYFVPGSYDRKGTGRFLKDRLIRLGIPLAVYSWIIDPLFVYVGLALSEGLSMPLWRFFPAEYFREHGPLIGAGPLWFIETLLIFSLVYVLWRLLTRTRPAQPAVEARFPGSGSIALFALLLALVAFVVRLWLPLGWNFESLNLQLPFFVLYIALFVFGLIAYRRNWLLGLPEATGRLWLGIAVLLILLRPPLMLAANAIPDDSPFTGGWRWEAIAHALWESFLCFGMCIGLVYLFRRYLDHQGGLAHFLSRNAYTTYIIHAWVITILAFAARDVALHPLLKFGLLSLVAVPLCFGLGSLIRKLPCANRVL
jgi:glucan biosynthesis protein C